MKFFRDDSYSKYSEVYSCYDPKLGSGCNLGKDLRRDRWGDQLVKYKDIELYLLLYIPIDHKK